jgi:hypothetical protein
VNNKSDLPSYAVLFKTHFWDEFCDRQFRRLCDRAGPGDVFVVVDETKGSVAAIRHDKIVRMTEQMSEGEGYLRYPAGNLFWYNTDYQVYHFFDLYPKYEYVVVCEYDCTINIEISTIIERMATQQLSFVGEPVRTPPSDWYWDKFTRPYYADDIKMTGRLVCFAVFSRTFARQLKSERQNHTRRAKSQYFLNSQPNAVVWPNNEAFVGMEIARLALSEASLSSFGDTSHYDWAPPHLEAELPRLEHCAFVHPVLDARRYIRSLVKLKWDLEDLFRPGSKLHTLLQQCDLADVVPMFLQHFAETKNWSALNQLRRFAIDSLGPNAQALFNVARGKPATQSSTCRWSRSPSVAQDAAGAVNGHITGEFGFHTDLEEAPWWCVDLEASYPISEVRIFNRMDLPGRSRSLKVSLSNDLMNWSTLYQHVGDSDFGGSDGKPLTIKLPTPLPLRFLRVSLTETQMLHLDEVEAYI